MHIQNTVTQTNCTVTQEGIQIFILFKEAVKNILLNETIALILKLLPLLLARKHTTVLWDSDTTRNHEPFARIGKHWPNDLPHSECAVLWFRVVPDSYYFNKQLRDWQETYLESRFDNAYMRYIHEGEAWTTHWRLLVYREFDYHFGQLLHFCVLIPGHVTRKRDKIINGKIREDLFRALDGASYISFYEIDQGTFKCGN